MEPITKGLTDLIPRIEGSGAITLANAEEDSGWFGLRFYLVVDGNVHTLSGGRLVSSGTRLVWVGEVLNGLEVELDISPSPTARGWAITPTLRNKNESPVAFSSYGFCVEEDKQGPKVLGRQNALPVYAHSDNLRYEKLPHSRVTYPFVRPLPERKTHIGTQASGPIPALILGHTDGRRWLVEGALTQERHTPSWYIAIPNSRKMLEYRSAYIWNGSSDEVIKPGDEVTLESTVYLLVEADLDQLYDPYMDELTTRYGDRFAGTSSLLAKEPCFCTWNFSVFTNITEPDCLRRMDIVSQVQRGGFFQIDHGYQRPNRPGEQPSPDVDAFYPDPALAWDTSRFPSGPRGFVAACRERNLRPSIWFSPRVWRNGLIAHEHPEWLLRDAHGDPISVEHMCLDASVPDVRAFLEHCIDTITGVWGFEGIKLDYFSYMFDHEQAVFQRGGTGTFWKNWLIRYIRRALGPEGYFLHCISCPLGNPFLALDGCDAYRAGIDIDCGEWEYHLRGSSWLLPSVLTHTRQTWFPNIDSILGHPEIPVVERRSRSAFAYLSGGMFEFSGPVERLDAEAMSDYRRLVGRIDQGQGSIRCPDTAAFYGRPLPTVLARLHASDSRTYQQFGIKASFGVFNWSDAPVPVSVSLLDLGVPTDNAVLSDFWTGQLLKISGGVFSTTLPPRGHALIDVRS
jgi:hypothetical protein